GGGVWGGCGGGGARKGRRGRAVERGWRWCRRNPALAVTSALAAAALLAVTGVSVALALQQSRAADAVRHEQGQTQAALEEAQTQRRLAEQTIRDLAREQGLTRAALKDSRRLSANLALERGLSLCEQGEAGRGLLWLARSLQEGPDDAADLRGAARANRASWYRAVSPLRACLVPKGAMEGEVFSAMRAMCFSPDGKLILMAAKDNTARLWEVATGKVIGKPLPHQHEIRAAAFSPDGKMVLTGSGNLHLRHDSGEAQLWEVTTGQPLGAPFKHPAAVHAVAFSPDGKTVLTG